jgi:hypothetical protein
MAQSKSDDLIDEKADAMMCFGYCYAIHLFALTDLYNEAKLTEKTGGSESTMI